MADGALAAQCVYRRRTRRDYGRRGNGRGQLVARHQPGVVSGGAGALDAVVLSGVTAVMLCELAGEIAERIARGRTNGSALQGGQRA